MGDVKKNYSGRFRSTLAYSDMFWNIQRQLGIFSDYSDIFKYIHNPA